jgi:hypothetical protein
MKLQLIILKIAGFFAAIGIGFSILLAALILYPFYYWRVTIVAIIVSLGALAYLSIITNGYSFTL